MLAANEEKLAAAEKERDEALEAAAAAHAARAEEADARAEVEAESARRGERWATIS